MVRIFRHYVPAQLVILAVFEAVLLFFSMYVGVALRYPGSDLNDLYDIVGPIAPRATVFMLVMIGTMTALGMFTRESQTGDLSYYMRFLASFAVGAIVLVLVLYLFPDLHLARGIFALAFAVAFVGSAVTRLVFLRFVDIRKLRRGLLVLGAGSRAAHVGALLDREESVNRKFYLIGYLVPGDSAGQPHVPHDKIIVARGSLLAIAIKYAADEIIVAIRDRRSSGLKMDELLECKLEGIRVTDISSFFERETSHVQLDSLNPSWMVYSDGFQRTSARVLLKRIFDVVVSLLLLVLTLPIMLVTALLIVLESGFPVFYRQERVGECGQIFQVLKFRSMRTDAEKVGQPQWAAPNDSRVTRVGRVIRKLRIDELPQVINVLRGDMSFVGPRPERPYFVKQLADQIPFFLNRHTVKPGITGWAQIRYPYGSSVEDAVQKLQYDLYYAKNHSLFLDLIILFQTAQVVLFGKGAR
jgi:sugar transferase (PEP-CTERM system associated)